MIITTYNPTKASKPDFFIARVGSKAGCPIKEPYKFNNCFAVYTQEPERDFQALKLAYDLGVMQQHVFGSVQPFIRLKDINRIASELPQIERKHLEALSAVEKQRELLAAQLDTLAMMQRALQQKIFFSN